MTRLPSAIRAAADSRPVRFICSALACVAFLTALSIWTAVLSDIVMAWRLS